MDLSKHPAPWRVEALSGGDCAIFDGNSNGVPGTRTWNRDLLERVCLWRNAEDVQMRRGWYARVVTGPGWHPGGGQWSWGVCDDNDTPLLQGKDHMTYPDPHTALVEADRWWEANRVHPQEVQP